VVYHSNPTDAKTIGEITAKYKGTFLVSTATFCSTYTRSVRLKDFSLRYVLVGAEKLREPIAAAFREKFGVELLGGYGCTEKAPVVAVNVPNYQAGQRKAIGTQARHGRPSAARRGRTVSRLGDLRTGAPESGRLALIKGSNRTMGDLGPSAPPKSSTMAGTSPAISPASMTKASSTSPTGFRASAK
jgi:acyl-[acyl-carrier-protein]-phospholipid O-acyltransferase/long-chain-fatty-acid--[acyl-carrier-protein] ligase